MSDNTLLIKGQKNPVDVEATSNEYFLNEIDQGSFYRAITLPADVESGGVDANYEDGVLHIILPKLKDSKATKIQINVSKKASD